MNDRLKCLGIAIVLVVGGATLCVVLNWAGEWAGGPVFALCRALGAGAAAMGFTAGLFMLIRCFYKKPLEFRKRESFFQRIDKAKERALQESPNPPVSSDPSDRSG